MHHIDVVSSPVVAASLVLLAYFAILMLITTANGGAAQLIFKLPGVLALLVVAVAIFQLLQ